MSPPSAYGAPARLAFLTIDSAAKQRDERAAVQLIDLHSLPPARDGLQDNELTANSLRVSERLHNLITCAEGNELAPFH